MKNLRKWEKLRYKAALDVFYAHMQFEQTNERKNSYWTCQGKVPFFHDQVSELASERSTSQLAS